MTTFKALDRTEHYPLPILDMQKFRGRGITLGCTHEDCRWRMDRQLQGSEGEGRELIELFALYHPAGGTELDLQMPVEARTGVGECTCPPEMPIRLRSLYNSSCPVHGDTDVREM